MTATAAGPDARTPEPDADVGVQLLDATGTRRPHPVYDRYIDDLRPEQLCDLYRDMAIIRRLDHDSEAMQRQGQLALWPSLLGQEAAQIGAGRALQPDDFAFPTYREHGVAHARGVDWVDMLKFWRGTHVGAWNPRAHNINTYSVIIPSQALHATGWAMGAQRRPTAAAALACFGDGATSQGDLAEAFVWASVFAAPVVFFCQNNQWAISEPPRRQTRTPIFRRADGYGFPGLRVDGNDVLAVLAVCTEALDRARAGHGPTLIEAYTYRMGAHTTSDDARRYRSDAETEPWRQRDPLLRFHAWLVAAGYWNPADDAALDAELDAEAARVRAGCLALPDPPAERMFEHVYAAAPPELRRQRDALLAEGD